MDSNTSGEDYQRRALEVLTGVPATGGNEVSILRNGVEIFPAMLEAISGAERTVDFLTFVYWAGDIGRRFAQAFVDAAKRGVRVRVLLDSIGARLIDNELVDVRGKVVYLEEIDDERCAMGIQFIDVGARARQLLEQHVEKAGPADAGS